MSICVSISVSMSVSISEEEGTCYGIPRAAAFVYESDRHALGQPPCSESAPSPAFASAWRTVRGGAWKREHKNGRRVGAEEALCDAVGEACEMTTAIPALQLTSPPTPHAQVELSWSFLLTLCAS